MHVVYRPNASELVAAAREAMRLRGLLARVRLVGVLLLVAGPLGLVLGQWLFTVYAVAFGAAVLVLPSRPVLARAVRRTPALTFDTSLEVTEDGLAVVVPTAASRIAWGHFSGWSVIPEGLLLVHSLQQRLFSFVPRSALTPELLDVIARHVPRHPRAARPRPGA